MCLLYLKPKLHEKLNIFKTTTQEIITLHFDLGTYSTDKGWGKIQLSIIIGVNTNVYNCMTGGINECMNDDLDMYRLYFT